MTDSRPPETLSGCRAQARRLLNDLRGADPGRARRAAARFLRLRSFAPAPGVDDLLAQKGRVQIRHALAVVAEENGAASWIDLRARQAAYRVTSHPRPPSCIRPSGSAIPVPPRHVPRGRGSNA